MDKPNRAARLYSVIEYYTKQVDFLSPPLASALEPLQLPTLAQKTQIASSNTSMILSQLHREGSLLRVGKRPVYYLALQPLEVSLNLRLPTNQFSSVDEFETFLISSLTGAHQKHEQASTSGDPFSQLIGSTGSLKQQIRQAKSALSYPPAGLHTLISGPVGAGKENFSRYMYQFALQKKLIPKNADLIIYDCANYTRTPTQAISRLFGHIAGALPTAKTDHIGFFEYANNGILVLSNVDKLVPEVQEKLIRYMLTRKYGRLGESDSAKTGNVRIIATSSEINEETVPSELIRHFPIRITLTALENRTIGERLRLILYFFWMESKSLKRTITLNPEIMSFFTHYSCPGNISQLMNDIKFSCSLAYYDSLSTNDSNISVAVQHLSPSVSQNFFIHFSNQRSLLISQQLRAPERLIDITGLRPFGDIADNYLLPDPDEHSFQ